MGLEPTTFWLPAKRSSQLSYIPKAAAKIAFSAKYENCFAKKCNFMENTSLWSKKAHYRLR